MTHTVSLWWHICAGTIALLSGVIAMLTRKGSKLHRRAGLVYVVGMLIVGATAIVMSIIRPNPFLFAVAIFSAAMALSGWLPARGDSPKLGKIIGVLSFLAAILLISVGILWIVTGDLFGIAAVVFGVISAQYGWRGIRRTVERNRQQRVVAHVSAMGGAFIATVSAVSAVNLDVLPPLVRWLWPTVIGTPLIVWGIRSYLNQNKPQNIR
jgi:uncharacterized membrane protein